MIVHIEPFYFGCSAKPLFGCYHAPKAEPARDCGVVLCYPIGQEYIHSHRAYRQLAVRLSSVGFPVLRFDYYGSGDSSGNCEQGRIRQWLADISTAIDEIRRRSGLVRVCLVGLRLGGTLSVIAGAERGDIEGIVLWEPVVSGRAYIEELTTIHQDMLRDSYMEPKHRTIGENTTEILGFPITSHVLMELEKIDLFTIRQKPANNILLIESHAEDGDGRLGNCLQGMATHVEYQELLNSPIWREDANQPNVLVPHETLQSVVSWMAEVWP